MLVSPPEHDTLTRAEATALTAEARAALSMALGWAARAVELVEKAWAMRADRAMGYETWEAYCSAEFAGLRELRIPIPTRTEIVAALTEAGMSTRKVGAALSITEYTVRRDLKRAATPHLSVCGEDVNTGKDRKPTTRAEQVLEALAEAGDKGMSWIELGQSLRLHHGQSSAALSRLHKQGRIERTGVYRQGSAVYVR